LTPINLELKAGNLVLKCIDSLFIVKAPFILVLNDVGLFINKVIYVSNQILRSDLRLINIYILAMVELLIEIAKIIHHYSDFGAKALYKVAALDDRFFELTDLIFEVYILLDEGVILLFILVNQFGKLFWSQIFVLSLNVNFSKRAFFVLSWLRLTSLSSIVLLLLLFLFADSITHFNLQKSLSNCLEFLHQFWNYFNPLLVFVHSLFKFHVLVLELLDLVE
jgi:hypothetical protein